MGKKLIIPGADFSANGIVNTVSLLDLLTLTLGKSWAASNNNSPHSQNNNAARASTDYTDISGYGFGTVNLEAKSGFKFACYFGNSNTSGVADSITTWTYTNSGETLTLDISRCRYCVVMVAATNGTDTLTSADINTYISVS